MGNDGIKDNAHLYRIVITSFGRLQFTKDRCIVRKTTSVVKLPISPDLYEGVSVTGVGCQIVCQPESLLPAEDTLPEGAHLGKVLLVLDAHL